MENLNGIKNIYNAHVIYETFKVKYMLSYFNGETYLYLSSIFIIKKISIYVKHP